MYVEATIDGLTPSAKSPLLDDFKNDECISSRLDKLAQHGFVPYSTLCYNDHLGGFHHVRY